jgi:hypothetical protein
MSTSLSATVCSDANGAIVLNTNGSSIAATSYTINSITKAGALVAGGSNATMSSGLGVGAIQNDVFTNTTSSSLTVIYSVNAVTGSCVGNAEFITLTVLPEPVVSTLLDATVCSDAANGITLATNGTSVAAAQYTINSIGVNPSLTPAGGNASSGPNKAASSILNDKFTNVTAGSLPVAYNVTPISSSSCAGNPYTVTLNVLPEPVVSGALDISRCSDTNSSIVLNTNGSSVAADHYTLNSISVQSGLNAATGNATTGLNKPASVVQNDIFTNSTGNSLPVTYNVTPISLAACSGNPFNVVLTVLPEPIGVNTTHVSTCSDVPFSFNPQADIANSVGANFTWTVAYESGLTGGAGAGSSAVAETLTNVSGSLLNAIYTVTPTSVANACLGNTYQMTVPIRSEPVGVNSSATVCSDVAVNYNLINNVAILGNNVGSTYTWSTLDNPNVTGESTSSQGGGIITDIITNVTNLQRQVVYDVTPTSSTGCTGNIFNISINIDPEPVGIVASSTICTDLNVAYDLQNNVNTIGNNLAANYSWTAGDNPNVSGEQTFAQTGSIINDVLVNATNSPELITYSITPTAQGTGCFGNLFTVGIAVNPRAKISAGPNLAQCRDVASILLQGSANYAPNGVVWTGGTGGYSSNTNPNASYSFNPASEVNTTFTLTLTALDPDGGGPCPLETDQMTLTVNPLPVVNYTGFPPGAPPQLAENNLPIKLTGNQIGGVFTITPSSSNIGSTVPNPTDEALFDPDAVTLGSNYVKYTFTDVNGCTNSTTQEVIVNPITNIDFAIQGATLNANSQFELCSELGLVKLIGFPAASSGLPPETRFISIPAYSNGPVATIVKIGDDYFIETTGLASGLYRIRYDYKNAFGAITFKIRDVQIFASPNATISSSNNCIASDVVFTDQSTIDPTPFPTNLASWQWNFGDGDFSTQQNPSKRYNTSSTYFVTLKVTTLQGCSNTSTPYSIRVGDVPIPDFDWSAICNFDFTRFEDESDPGNISTITNVTWDFGDGEIISGPVGTPVPGAGTTTRGTYDIPEHKYQSFGTYDATITVLTNDGCANSVTKKVFILPYSTVQPVAGAAYFENFEVDDGGWIAEAIPVAVNIPLSDTSWVWGIPTGANINSGAGNSAKAWWTGRNTSPESSYFPNEHSVVNGPCFDLSQLRRPMISLDYFVDADVLDGAVLQYSTNGGIDWFIIGSSQNLNQGINWFNAASIFANPGLQTIGQVGWTGTSSLLNQGRWINARFNLDMIDPVKRSQVRIRVAFASNDGNASVGPYNGFAFDNVFVGDKKRTVLVENFTNLGSSLAKNARDYLNTLYDDQALLPHPESDFFKIQYHVGIPSMDVLNNQNPTDPGARAFFYNVTQPPITIMDGILGSFYNKNMNGDHANINAVELDRRALEDPTFVVNNVTFDATAPSNVLRATIDLTYIDSLVNRTEPVIFQVALLEDNVVQTDVVPNRNVLRKFLLQPEGFAVNRTWTYQDIQTLNIDYTLDVPVNDPNNLYLAIFVQDKTTGQATSRRILQSAIVKAPAKVGVPPVGIEDDPATAEIRNISVYPNPASKVVNFYLENELTRDYTWQIIDQRGVMIMNGLLNNDLSTPQQVSIDDLANGIYFVRFGLPDKTLVYRKIAVLNKGN